MYKFQQWYAQTIYNDLMYVFWYFIRCYITHKGRTYNSSEQLYQSRKALFYGDERNFNDIMVVVPSNEAAREWERKEEEV